MQYSHHCTWTNDTIEDKLLLWIGAHCTSGYFYICWLVDIEVQLTHTPEHETLNQCRVNAGPPSTTSAQHLTSIGSISRVFLVIARLDSPRLYHVYHFLRLQIPPCTRLVFRNKNISQKWSTHNKILPDSFKILDILNLWIVSVIPASSDGKNQLAMHLQPSILH